MFRLALALGMTVRRLLAEIDSRELAEWMAFATLDGLPESRADFRAGQVCATFANIHRRPDAKALGPADFMPDLSRDTETTPDDEQAVLLDDPEAQSRLIMAAVFGISD